MFGREENRRTRRKNLEATGEINYDNSIHVSPKFSDSAQMVTHQATDPVRPGLTWSLVVNGNALTVYTTPGAAPGFIFFTNLGRPASVKVGTVLRVAFVKARRM